MKGAFVLLWSKILRSSIWVTGTKEARLVWVTILALKDSEGIVQSSMVGLADAAKVTPDECREAMQVFLSPDPNDSSGVEDGRKLREVPGGWQVVNHDLYRFSTEAKREFWRAQKAEQREKQAAYLAKKKAARTQKHVQLDSESRERRADTCEKNGDQAGFDRVTAENLPGELQ